MNPQLMGLLLGTLLSSSLIAPSFTLPTRAPRAWVPPSSTSSSLPGNRMRCSDCSGGPSSSCKETVATCGKGERFPEQRPHSGQEKIKLPGNPSGTLCVAAQHCSPVEIEVVGDVACTTHRNGYLGGLYNSAAASSVAPAPILAAVASTLAWFLPGLWRG